MADGLSYANYRRQFHDLSVAKNIIAATAPGTTLANVLTVKNTSYTIFVQRITWNVFTSHADTIEFKDDASTPILLASTIASPALGHHIVLDAGPIGFALTEGKNLDGTGGAGPAGTVYIEAYQKLTAVIAHTAANQ